MSSTLSLPLSKQPMRLTDQPGLVRSRVEPLGVTPGPPFKPHEYTTPLMSVGKKCQLRVAPDPGRPWKS